MENDADEAAQREDDRDEEEERIARAGRTGRRVGTVIMVLFGAWFVGTTVYNFAAGVFGGFFGEN